MASLRNFFHEEKRKRDESLAQKPQSIEDDADFERISKINDEWNRNVAKMREARLTKERTEMRKRIEWELEQQREYEEEERRRVNEMVLKEKVCKFCMICVQCDRGADCVLIYYFHSISTSRKPQNRLLYEKILTKHLSWH